jgi:tetratricopeptide (TPR) repeat protein
MNRHIVSAGTALLLSIALVNVPWAETAPSSSPSPAASPPSADSAREPIFDGLGNLHHAVTTNSPLAQRFFDQGLTFVYAFNHDEAVGSFKEAARLDPKMAMAYWGIALSLGPNINLPEDTDRGKAAYEAIKHAQSLEANVSEPERQYIEALAKRYAADGKMNDSQQQAYANAMRDVAHRNPDDPDAGALFAESMMDLHPWKLWNADGTPVAGTDEIVATLEGVLAKFPDHVGANHYYIHAVEASNNPGRALASADRLGKMVPAAGHLVHMPSHIYMRVGDYQKSADANESATKADRVYIRERNPKGIYPLMYFPHNVQFAWASYMMEGDSKDATRASRQLNAAAMSPESLAMLRQMPMAESELPSRYFTEARFGQWTKILKEPAPPAEFQYLNGIWHYVRGLAFAAKGKPDPAGAEQKKLDEITAAMPADRVVGFNSGKKLLALASATLSGEIAAARGDHDGAVKNLRDAVAIQDSLDYEEPPPWYYPVRETLGMELISDGKPGDAEQVFRDDLKQYPEDGWSLDGLAICLRSRNDTSELSGVEDRFKKAWAHADVQPPAASIPAQLPKSDTSR